MFHTLLSSMMVVSNQVFGVFVSRRTLPPSLNNAADSFLIFRGTGVVVCFLSFIDRKEEVFEPARCSTGHVTGLKCCQKAYFVFRKNCNPT